VPYGSSAKIKHCVVRIAEIREDLAAGLKSLGVPAVDS
jgi:hypothetical protein